MNLNERIEAFKKLGGFLEQFRSLNSPQLANPLNREFYRDFQQLIQVVSLENPWFTPNHVCSAIKGISFFLQEDNLRKWISRYPIPAGNTNKRIAVIMAGNIPLVGFHDMLCVLMAGHQFIGKLSSKDNQLLNFITRILVRLHSGFKSLITFCDDRLADIHGVDAIIATGSNNTARYFEAYFQKYPHIFRRNRNSVAVLTGTETLQELRALGEDVFLYFGLGCRNVSKLYLPAGYKFQKLLRAWKDFSGLIHHNKYANNYNYQKTLFLMNRVEHIDIGTVLLKQDSGFISPVSVVLYEFYSDLPTLKKLLKREEKNIQCIVAPLSIFPKAVPCGCSQKPQLWDYSDNVDTMKFLTTI